MDAKERLIESARELLWERGYVGTSPRAIQQRAGAGQGSMYHHFSGGKPELALAAMELNADQLRAESEELLSGPGSPAQRLAAYLIRERDALRGCRIGRLTQDPEVIASEELRAPVDELFGWLRGRLARVVAEAQQAGELPERLVPAEIAASTAAVIQGGYVLARAGGDPAPFAEAVNGMLALLGQARGV
jgi:TetR/AcrR family transcriptional regulator, transcriptional repressor for nem operon